MLKTLFWVAIILVIAYFGMGYFGYQINSEYFSYSKKNCQERLKECSDSLIHKGIDNVECDMLCINPNIIIKKK
jgi:hypothetical protein